MSTVPMREDGRGSMATRAYRSAKSDGGFTLLEILVAMALLMVIVMVVAQIFTQARTVWDTGKRRADASMKGRAVADFMAQELSMAIRSVDHPEFSVTEGSESADFWTLGEAGNGNSPRAAQRINYETGTGWVKRNGDKVLEDSTKDGDPFVKAVTFHPDPQSYGNELPFFVDVRVTVSDGGSPAIERIFESRAYMVHRQRYSMD